jgi:hypothetical protein
MSIECPVGPLFLCSWLDERGHIRRQTFSPKELVLHDPGHLTWLRTLIRMAPRWRVVATC